MRDYLFLGSRRVTLFYWASVALVVSGFFVTKLLPCVDYPQHLALSDVARRLADPSAPEHAEYQLNYFTYNGLFHVVVAHVSTIFPIELAGRMIVAASIVALAGAVVALFRVTRRPPEHVALFIPVLFSFSLGWGFVNYVTATAIAAWTLVVVSRAAVRPTFAAAAGVAILGLACAFAHVLAMLILCLLGAAFGLELAWRGTSSIAGPGASGRRARVAFLRVVAAVAPLLVGCVYCILVYKQQYAWDPAMYRDPTIEGSAPPIWEKLAFFGAYTTDLYRDGTDQIVLWIALGAMGLAAYLSWARRASGDRSPEESPPIVAPFAAIGLAYLLTPMVLIGTHLIFPRLAQWVVLGAALATPRIPLRLPAGIPRWTAWLGARATRWMAYLAVVAGVSAVLHCALFSYETGDASAMIDDLPAGGAATAVIWDPGTFAFRNGTLTHLAAYYAARKHGSWAFAFARYLSVPVRFKPNAQPAWPARGWEFNAEDYDPRCKYARAFPLVLVKAPAELPRDASGEAFVRKLVFKRDRDAVRLLSHHGRYWAFDTTGLPDDGTF